MTFLADRGGTPEIRAVAVPTQNVHRRGRATLEQVLAHEREVTGRIHGLFEKARAERDFASEVALQWCVSEHVEEEAAIGHLVEQLHAIGDKGGGVWYLVSRLAKRGKTRARSRAGRAAPAARGGRLGRAMDLRR